MFSLPFDKLLYNFDQRTPNHFLKLIQISGREGFNDCTVLYLALTTCQLQGTSVSSSHRRSSLSPSSHLGEAATILNSLCNLGVDCSASKLRRFI